MPKVSIIVPVYNVEKYIKKCINSILDQTERDFELLLIDDGSPDKSGNICDEFALIDNRIKVFHKVNGGVSSARNLGLDNAVGDMIFFIDSDDFIEPDYIEQLKIRDDEDFVQSGVRILENDYLKSVMTHEEIFLDYNQFWMQSRQQWPTMCCLSKRIIDKYHLRFNEKLKMGEDGLFNHIFLSKCSKIRRITYNGYNYNWDNSQSASHKYYENRLEQQVLLVTELKKFFEEQDIYRVIWDYWHEVLKHYKVKGIGSSDPVVQRSAKKKIKETYNNKLFRKCIVDMRRNGSLDEKIETYFMRSNINWMFNIIRNVLIRISK